MAAPTLVDISQKPRPKYKHFPYTAMKTDLTRAFSKVPTKVIYIEDICKYIQAPLADINHTKFKTLRLSLLQAGTQQYLPQYQNITKKKLDFWREFLDFTGQEEWVCIILNRFHDEYLYLDQPYRITKATIQAATGLWAQGEVTPKKATKNAEVTCLTEAMYDGQSLDITKINNLVLKYATMGIAYKVYYTNR